MRCWVAIRHRGFSVSEVFGECKKIELASVLEWVKVVNFSWLTIRCVWITWFSCSLRILFFSVYIIEAILSWTFVWLMCCSKCIWMSVAFSLVFDSRFLGFWLSRFLVFFLGFHSVSPHYASTDHQVLCEADPFGRFRILGFYSLLGFTSVL